jgi:hypothetical protein
VTATIAASQVGQRFTSGPVGLTADSLAVAPAPNDRLHVQIGVAIENLGQTPLGFSPAYFKLTDAAGATYPSGAPGTTLPASSGGPGLLARATVAFEVPAAAHGLTLSYEPSPVPSGYQTIKIALGEV